MAICGGTSGSSVELSLPKLFWKQHELIGSSMGSYLEFDEVTELVEAGAPVTVDAVLPLDRYPEALERLSDGAQLGKIVLAHGDPDEVRGDSGDPPSVGDRDALHGGEVHRRGKRHPPPVLHQPPQTGLRAGQPSRSGQGCPLRAVQPLAQLAAPPLPRRVRRRARREGRPIHRRDGRARTGRGSLRPRLPRIRRRFRCPARRGPPRLRAGLQRAHQGARVGPADVLPRAVDPLHLLRHPVGWLVPLLPGSRGPGVSSGHPVRRRSRPPVRRLRRLGAEDEGVLPRADAEGPLGLRLHLSAGDQGQGLRHRPRHPPGSFAVQRGHLRQRPGLRGPVAPHAGPPAARGPRYAGLMLSELRKVIPSFLKRVDLPDRGAAWSEYFSVAVAKRWRTSSTSCSRLPRSRPTAPTCG